VKLITVQEFEAMTPQEQDAAFEAAKVRDLSAVPTEHLARVRARLEARIAQEQASTAQ
jgi:hypothetical protein